MGPSHRHTLNTTSSRLVVTMVLNFVITIAELIGGIISGSLSLISDALHNFSDGISVIISYIAIRLKRKDTSILHTFGLKRAEILAAVFNSAVLTAISIYLFYVAILRFSNPVPIESNIMILVASIGLAANIAGTLLLKRDSKSSMNIKSSYLHLLSDAVSSVAVILGGLAIYFWKIYWIDPLLTILIGIYIIKESISIINDAIHILMEGAPKDISIDEIKETVESFEKVDDLHHLHIWSVGEKDIHMEAHLNIKNMLISESDKLRTEIENTLMTKYKINHITLQFECNKCEDSGLIHQHT